MTTAPHADAAAPLDEVVRGTPGVGTLYRSDPLLSRIVASGTRALQGAPDRLVLLDERDGSVTVTATIGVEQASAAQTCRAVHDAIAAHLRRHGVVDPTIVVTVARVVE